MYHTVCVSGLEETFVILLIIMSDNKNPIIYLNFKGNMDK